MAADVDTLLLDRVFQPIADRIHPSATCFALARACLIAAMLAQGIALAGTLLDLADPVARAAAGGIALLAAAGGQQAWRLIARVERQARPGLLNPRRITLRWQRWAWLTISAWTAGTALAQHRLEPAAAAAAALAWAATLYFVSCSPRRPIARFSVYTVPAPA